MKASKRFEFNLRKILVSSATSLSLVLAALVGIAAPAQAAVTLTPGPSAALKLTTTVPSYTNPVNGKVIGTAAGEFAITRVNIQLVLKSAPAEPADFAWYWPNLEAGSAISTTYRNALSSKNACLTAAACSTLGLFKVDVLRSGSPVVFSPSYFAPQDGNGVGSRVEVAFKADNNILPVGTVVLQAGDEVSVSFRDGYFDFPEDIAENYEFRYTFGATEIATGNSGGPLRIFTQTTVDAAQVATTNPPTATALVGKARVTPDPVSPAPRSYLITASPQVAGATKTCTVTPPATYCDVTGLTAGEAYTFTSQAVPTEGVVGPASVASAPVTPSAAPSISGVSPTTGAISGGTAITITGTNFVAGATVTVGGAACTDVVVVSATSITCVTPAGTAGAKNIIVTNADGGAALTSTFSYFTPPTATTVEPNTGSTAGGTSITLTGTNFVAGATVTVGGAACTDVVVVSATSITCVTPAGTAGAKDVVVTNTNGGTATSAAGFTYTTPFRSVTFNANGGTGTLANSSKNAASALPANTFARTGYVFKGWNTNAKGTGNAYANKASYSYSADLTLYAQWTAVPSGKKLSKNISIFAGDQAALTSGMKADIATWVKKLPTNATIQCVGSTQGDKVSAFDTKLATSRAKNVCVEAVKVRSDLKYTLKANPSTSTKAAARNVWIYQK